MMFFIQHSGKEYRVKVETVNQSQVVTLYHPESESEESASVAEPSITFNPDTAWISGEWSFLHQQSVFQAPIVHHKNAYTVYTSSGPLSLTVESEYKRLVGTLRRQASDHERDLTAKMPGKIVKVFKAVGDIIEKGDSLLVMEAMKMENELRSPMTGKIRRILVSEGQAVEAGATLAEFDPLDQ